jgi:hypothetical protein
MAETPQGVRELKLGLSVSVTSFESTRHSIMERESEELWASWSDAGFLGRKGSFASIESVAMHLRA